MVKLQAFLVVGVLSVMQKLLPAKEKTDLSPERRNLKGRSAMLQ